jgi:imidazolonepropionase-like amidohydrolase
VAITNVDVISMVTDSVTRDVTVLVRDGRIGSIGRTVVVPAGARRVDGRGMYLIPGLADMHTHLYADEALPDSVAPAELGVILANGVTTARIMIGAPKHFPLRDGVAAGRILGPQLWVASPQLAGRPYHNGIAVTTPDEARAAVRAVADSGYDFVKLTLFITPPVYDAIVGEAARGRIRVVGHVEPEVGVARALAAGQQIEHLDGYFEAVLADSAPMRTSLTQQRVFDPASWASLDYMDDGKIARIAGATARAGVWSSPTLNVFNKAFADMESDTEIRGRPDWDFLPPAVRRGYLGARARYWSAANQAERTEARRRRYVDVRNKLVKAISDSGGRLLTGSDTPEWFHAYGWGLHRELQAFVAAGLTPYQALTAATTNAAEFLGQSAEWGTIEPGKRADLVLVRGNPLVDIRHTSAIEAVVSGGRVLGRAELDRLISAGSRAIDGAAR